MQLLKMMTESFKWQSIQLIVDPAAIITGILVVIIVVLYIKVFKLMGGE